MTKVSRTFRIDQKLSTALDKLYTRHGDNTYHVEQALSTYLPIMLLDAQTKTEVAPPKKAAKRFTPPTLQEAGNYFLSRGSQDSVNEADKFIDFYESKGWMVGKNKMKSWQAAVRNWMKGSSTKKAGEPIPTLSSKMGDRSWAKGIVDGI